MNKIILLLATFILCLNGHMQAQSARKVVILHTNDMHSRLDGFSPSLEYTPGL
ncbi:MAG: hypothetical protein R2744_13170 [Bacteroidales bacterium]